MTRVTMTLFWFSLTLVVSLGLYHTSYRVEDMDRQLRALNKQIEAEQRNIHVLKAEWVYLANPARIEEAARKHLDLQPTSPQQIASMGRIADVIPARASLNAKAATVKEANAITARPATHKPKVASSEQGRLNTHLVITKTAALEPASVENSYLLHNNEETSFNLANSGTAQ